MKPKIESLSFEAWLKAIFEHPREGPLPVGRRWFFSPHDAPSGGEQAVILRYLERLFGDAPALLARYSDDEAADGLWYLLSPGLSGHLAAMTGGEGPLEARLSCLRALEALFREFFTARCPNALSGALAREGSAFPSLPDVLYMWWHEFPRHGQPRQPGFDEEVLALLKSLLSVPHLGVQESAVHGLGHWRDAYKFRVRRILYPLWRSTTAPEPLRLYASKAMSGAIQ